MYELKPCPFCGGEAKFKVKYEKENYFYYCECTKCGARTRSVYPLRNLYSIKFCGRDKVICLWNQRSNELD